MFAVVTAEATDACADSVNGGGGGAKEGEQTLYRVLTQYPQAGKPGYCWSDTGVPAHEVVHQGGDVDLEPEIVTNEGNVSGRLRFAGNTARFNPKAHCYVCRGRFCRRAIAQDTGPYARCLAGPTKCLSIDKCVGEIEVLTRAEEFHQVDCRSSMVGMSNGSMIYSTR